MVLLYKRIQCDCILQELDLFEREARVLKSLDHPGIPAYIDYFQVCYSYYAYADRRRKLQHRAIRESKVHGSMVRQVLPSSHHLCLGHWLKVDTDADRVFYIAQRAAKGKSLEDLVTGGWRVSEEKVKLIALEVSFVQVTDTRNLILKHQTKCTLGSS